ncbi:unnamed protein product [Didymodactylos carnosus]|uniref:Uncharacterized protein n=1 Tax=Didymodactylos carnosus TaxID=1234261 RepID=A0A815E464_9BILA|nr:unnamed protein product [Didymodactylos carnosus]CAF1306300.1 unnamed protein product [Didymodactylos carnosus]CAF3828920.1 unnamed protein product [Didymodactylos carnosus]CAF4139686.1 unnamed protein product [Didymodactylos carnosus]
MTCERSDTERDSPSRIDDYPVINGYYEIDPLSYCHRIGLYKMLILESTEYMPFARDISENILFGLAAQHSWQYETFRLSDLTNRTTCGGNSSTGALCTTNRTCISPNSWWATMNYYLSVIPFLAAVNASVIKVNFTIPFKIKRIDNFCTTYAECIQQTPNAIEKWTSFFSNISTVNYCEQRKLIVTTDDPPEYVDQCYLRLMWNAHIASIDDGLPLAEKKLSYMSPVEQHFGIMWAHLVYFIAYARLDTNLNVTLELQIPDLPNRLLNANDNPPHIDDQSKSCNDFLHLIFSVDYKYIPEFQNIWKSVTCNYRARIHARKVIETLLVSKIFAFAEFTEAEAAAKLYPCD